MASIGGSWCQIRGQSSDTVIKFILMRLIKIYDQIHTHSLANFAPSVSILLAITNLSIAIPIFNHSNRHKLYFSMLERDCDTLWNFQNLLGLILCLCKSISLTFCFCKGICFWGGVFFFSKKCSKKRNRFLVLLFSIKLRNPKKHCVF